MLPLYIGLTKKVPGYDFLIATDIVTVPPEQAMPTVEEMKQLRGVK
jgi:branched-chain amino acid transport system substrate-binding protein